MIQVKMSSPHEPSAGQRRPDRCSLACERLHFVQTTGDPRRPWSKVGSPDVVGRTHRRGSAGHFLTAMKAAAGFPGSAGSPGVRRRQGFRGVQTEGSCGAAGGERRGAGRGGGRAALRRPGAEGPPGEASQPAASRWGGAGGRSWANALGLWAERLTPQRRAGGRFPLSQFRTPGLPKAGGFAR